MSSLSEQETQSAFMSLFLNARRVVEGSSGEFQSPDDKPVKNKQEKNCHILMSHHLQVVIHPSLGISIRSSSSEYEKGNTIISSSEHSISNDTMKRICWQDPVATTSMMKQCDEKKEASDEKPQNSDCTYDKKEEVPEE